MVGKKSHLVVVKECQHIINLGCLCFKKNYLPLKVRTPIKRTGISLSEDKNFNLLDKPLYSSVTHALNQLSWLNLKQCRLFHRCLHVYKCVNRITSHKLELSRNSDVHRYCTHCKDDLRLRSVKRNWVKQRTCYQAFKDWNASDSDLKNSDTICQFRSKLLNIF